MSERSKIDSQVNEALTPEATATFLGLQTLIISAYGEHERNFTRF
jgi:hypothetical protein